MKILVLSSLAYSLVNFRGELLAEMRKQGHEVVAVAPDRDAEVADQLGKSQIPLRHVPMSRTGTNPVRDAWTMLCYLRLMRAERPDIVLAYTQKPIIYGGIAARIYARAGFFALMSGLGYLFSDEARGQALVKRLFVRLYRAGLRRSRKVFVFNKDDRADMIAAGIIGEDHVVLQVPGSGVDTRYFTAEASASTVVTFLMISRLMRDKGVHDFVKAAELVAARHPQVRFQILGRIEPDNRTGIDADEVAMLAARYPVEFLPETRDVRPHLAACSVFVLPSYYREGLPRTILEALAAGRPVITTDMPGCRDPIEPGVNGLLIPPRSPVALADAMCRLIENKGDLAQMSRRARETAVDRYDVRLVNRILLASMGLLRSGAQADQPGLRHLTDAA
ncbi:glycosyltransferase involved in cell wall biosynthesis [Novosphingobium hassiacum]|uniref:Glycosyltransferase involved in cell wall biosynthesis n=1 Tax=Novosphingobium hassiacum TaxID=173676 RepID=A0A7W6A145_9SPHN|nr:glycosyltransferase family 4 protein [Novosphingobium hassiacum]MBB3862557.1 glycosyltransferase involved in cell wall biosynthesis [Novosphingobium hassiacum]